MLDQVNSMIYHITYRDAGGINTYIDNLIDGSSLQTKIELVRDQKNLSSNILPQTLGDRDTLIFHDPQIWRSALCKSYSKHIIALHGDNQYYYDAVEELGTSVDGLLCVSSNIQDNLRPRFKQKALLLGPSVPLNSSSAARRREDSIIFVGREDANKGVQHLPRLDQLLLNEGLKPQWTLVLGSRPETHQEFRKWTKRERQRIILHESLPNDVVTQLITDNCCLVLPSKTEGHPMVVIEALANGVAPFTFHYSSHCAKHLPRDPEDTVSPSQSIEAMARKITAYLSQPAEEKDQWRASAFDFIEKNHNPTNQRLSLETFCNTISANKKSHSILKQNRWKRRILRAINLW